MLLKVIQISLFRNDFIYEEMSTDRARMRKGAAGEAGLFP